MIRRLARCFTVVFLLGLLTAPAFAQESLLEQFEEKITTFTLDNGLTFVIAERHDAPVVSFHTYADVGAVNEPAGQTGLAHLFEHMAFKGTTSIGTEDIEEEMAAIERQEEIYLELRRARVEGDSATVHRLEAAFEEATKAAKELVISNEYDRILQKAGVVGRNASTFVDWTRYYYSLPANRVELFFALESDRFMNPVFREFYTERDVVMEERRLRTESTPSGRLMEAFLATAFKAHPYGRPTVGFMSDLKTLSRTDAIEFFEAYYVPSNLTIAIVGDVNPERVRALAEEYFGRLPAGDPPPLVRTVEPEQQGERRVTLVEETQPFVFIGYHRPSGQHPDDAAYDVLADVLSQGRTSRFHNQLVEEEIALQANAVSTFPGEKFPTLFWIIGVPTRDVSAEKLETEVYTVLEDIKENGITQEELERAQTRARAGLIRALDSNSGLAYRLAGYEERTGEWRNLFRQLQEIEAVTVADVQRIARETFQQSNRTVAMIKNAEEEATTASTQQ